MCEVSLSKVLAIIKNFREFEWNKRSAICEDLILKCQNKQQITGYSPLYPEILSSINYLVHLIYSSNVGPILHEHELQLIQATATQALLERVKNCWYPENPLRGSAKRLISQEGIGKDNIISRIESECNLGQNFISAKLPHEFYIWTDPFKCSVRIGGDWSPTVDIYPVIEEDLRVQWMPSFDDTSYYFEKVNEMTPSRYY